MIFIVLQGTPIPKARARVVKRYGIIGSFTPKKSADYSDDLAWAAQIEMKGKKMLEGALSVQVCCYMPIPKSDRKAKAGQPHTKKPDLDNIIKQLDALNGIVWKDDSQIAMLTATKVYSHEPRLTIQAMRLV